MTLLGPERLPLSPQRGTPLEVTWPELLRWIASPVVTEDKASAGGFTLAKLRGGVRRKDHVESVSALALDHDAGTMQPTTAHERLGRYRHVVYSTWQSTTEAPRWRTPLLACRAPSCPMNMGSFGRVPLGLSSKKRRLTRPRKTRADCGTCPRSGLERPQVCLVGDGALLDVDRMVAAAGARTETAYVPHAAVANGDKYVRAAIERECAAVASAGKGNRNTTLNRAAYSLSRLHIGAVEIADALLVAAKQAGLPESEARKTITSALRARRGRA